MIDIKKEIKLGINYNTKLSGLGQIYYIMSYVTDYVIIKFYDIIAKIYSICKNNKKKLIIKE